MLGWLRKLTERRDRIERRSSGGYTAMLIAERAAHVAGRTGLGELTATVQACVSLWEHGLSIGDVTGTDLLGRPEMAMIGRALALRGESVWLIRDDRLVPCAEWELATREGRPAAYRLTISEAGGGVTMTALAAEVLHVRIGCDPATPWYGTPPLRRASLTAALLHAVEAALAEVYENAPLGSQIVPFPEAAQTDLESLGRDFRGRRGRVLLRESVNVSAAGGPGPSTDWRPADVTPDLSRAMTRETLDAARNAICAAYGVLPALLDPDTTGPLVREAQRHLAQWTLAPVAALIAAEASDKLGGDVTVDVMTPLQAYDSGGRARALAVTIDALAKAKEAGLSEQAIAAALSSSVGIGEPGK